MGDVWAVFNLDIQPDNLSFPVALGGTITGEPDPGPDSAVIRMNASGERLACQVFVHADQAQRRHQRALPLRKLEIISPVYMDGVEWECQEQFSLALRLFRYCPFWVSSWDRRNEVRVWPAPPIVYTLPAAEVSRFRDFSERLAPFQEGRNIYRFSRHPLYRQDDLANLFLDGEDQKTLGAYLARTAYLHIALDFFQQSLQDWWLSNEMRLLSLMIGAEALFSDDDKAELAYRLSHRISVLNASSPSERKKIFEVARKCYGLRSRLMHGSLYREKKGFLEVEWDDVLAVGNLVRASLLYYFAWDSQGLDKRQILMALDWAVLDERELITYRAKANQAWGLGESIEEHIYSGLERQDGHHETGHS